MFLSYPGYVPSHSFCGSQYQELQKAAKECGISRLMFNSRANRMGILLWTLCKERLKELRANSSWPMSHSLAGVLYCAVNLADEFRENQIRLN